jgi:hypothetical protein
VNHGVELIWLAFALVFMGSFGLGWTVEEMMRKQKRDIHVSKDE